MVMPRGWGVPVLAFCLTAVTPPSAQPTLTQQHGHAAVAIFADKAANGGLTMRLSGMVFVTLSVDGLAPVEVETGPRVIDSPGWKVRTAFPAAVVLLGKGRERWQQTFQLAPLDKGDQPLLVASLRYREKRGAWHTVEWQPIPLTVTTSINRVDVGEVRDITDIEQLPELPPWHQRWLWVGLGLLTTFLALIVWLFVRRRRRAARVLLPEQAALREMGRLTLLKLPQSGRGERFHTLLSNILRRYFEARFHLPARRQTTTEFLEAVRQLPELDPARQQLLRAFLERCDLAKFAGVASTAEECDSSAAMARALVEQAKDGPPG
jgi:hypothetical protein